MLNQHDIDAIYKDVELITQTHYDTYLLIICRLFNGFVFSVGIDCRYVEDCSYKTANKILHNRIKDKIWELESYKTQENIYGS